MAKKLSKAEQQAITTLNEFITQLDSLNSSKEAAIWQIKVAETVRKYIGEIDLLKAFGYLTFTTSHTQRTEDGYLGTPKYKKTYSFNGNNEKSGYNNYLNSVIEHIKIHGIIEKDGGEKMGRTFWDWLAEHPKVATFTLLVILILFGVLIYNGYSIKTDAISVTKGDSFPKKYVDSILNINAEVSKKLMPPSSEATNNGTKEHHKKVKGSGSANITVTSYSQSGGVTAYSVDMSTHNYNGVKPRVFDKLAQLALEFQLREVKKDTVSVGFIMEDVEAHNFAKQIHDFLAYKGYVLKPLFYRGGYIEPPIGESLDIDKNGDATIFIGHQRTK